MITLDDIVKRSSYINNSNMNEEYFRFHNRTKLLLESNVNRFADKKFILQHWQSLNENQTECFKIVIDMLEEAYENDNLNDFNYIKSYIINEVTPTVRDAKQTSRYLKYKTTKIKNKITGNLRKNVENIKNATKTTIQATKTSDVNTIKTAKDNIKKSIGKEDVHEAYIEILDTLEKYNHCDRILENAGTIQKRFNIMSMIESTNINDDIKLSVLIDSICECINTYNIDFSTKFNSVLETCFYFLERTRKSYNKELVLEQIVNNFISKDLPNANLLAMRSIIESTVIIDNSVKSNIEFIYNTLPFESVKELAEPFKDNKDIKTIIESISDNMADTDVRKVLSCISNTDASDVNFETVNDLISKMCSLYTGDDFNSLCSNELLKVRESGNEEYIKILNRYASKTKVSESEFIMDFDMYNEAFEKTKNTIKDIINEFKLKKMKNASDPRTCVSKMFTKSPDQIIDGTPNFLSWLRLSYVIGATAIHPILGAVTLLIDQFIAMKLKRRDISKMITVFKNERKVVEEKIKKADDKDKANLKEYDKYLKNGLDKLKEYEDSLLTDNEIYARDNGEEYDRDEELSFIKDDDDDFSLEATSFEKLFEKSDFFSKTYFTDNIQKYISEMTEDTIDVITDIACRYPNIISTNRLYVILKEELDEIRNTYSNNKNWVRLSCLSSNAEKVNPGNPIITSDDPSDIFEVITGLDDLFIEYSINRTMGFTNESASTNIKMLTNKFRKIMQKVSDTDKEISRKIDSSVNMFLSAIQRAARNDNREAIIRGSILPSASKIVKTAIVDGGVALINPAVAVILALGQFAISKKMKVKERQLVLDEIDIELEMCKRYLRQAEDQNDLEAQKKLLQIQRNLERQKQRIKYNMKIHWNQDVPNVARDDD